MFKRLFTAFLLSIFIFSSGTYAKPHEYLDIPRDSEYFYPIDYLRRNDVFRDTLNFRPEIIISKAEFIKYLVILNSPDFKTKPTADLPYADTRNNAWYSSYFKEAIRLGIISDLQQNIDPYKKLSVIDALTLLFHSQSIPIPKVYKGTIPYTDLERNKQAAPLIMRGLEFDLIKPQRADYVGIYRRINRADAARMIYKMDLVNLEAPTSITSSKLSFDSQLQKIVDTWDLIFSNYVDKDSIDKVALSTAAIRGMVEALDDPYSSYLDREANMAFTDEFDGEIEGIGAFIGLNDDKEIVVISPIGGSGREA